MRNAVLPKLKQRRRDRTSAVGCPELGQRFADEVEIRHHDNDLTFSDAVLRMFRDGALGGQSDAYKELAEYLSHQRSHGCDEDEARGRLRVHVMWGSSDVVVTEKQIHHILHLLSGKAKSTEDLDAKGITYKKMQGMEHNLMLSHPRISADEIVQFLNRP